MRYLVQFAIPTLIILGLVLVLLNNTPKTNSSTKDGTGSFLILMVAGTLLAGTALLMISLTGSAA
ncbi:MAG: hypothetical protein HN856_14195 [Gammaproteobacteria bacterium]|jgi:hypothetical protein|nr:hypothetical protein [Gammaproteobacteria bacterium]